MSRSVVACPMATKTGNKPLIKALIIAVILAAAAYALIFWNPNGDTVVPTREIPAPEAAPAPMV